jgi:extracellular factor (EF) 3-hydroxypalmitic acid methyl ester biosynthesis protein
MMSGLIPFPSGGLTGQPGSRSLNKESMVISRRRVEAEELSRLFDRNQQTISSNSQLAVSKSMDEVIAKLNDFRRVSSPEAWKELVEIARIHPLFDLVRQDPFNRRAFDQPRGYPGDAKLIDFIYGSGKYAEEIKQAPLMGRKIYLSSRMSAACQAVRGRRDLVANLIGETLARRERCRILSVAAGHLREADQIPWNGVDNLDLFLAVDQDPDSLAEIARQNYHPNLVTEQKTVGQVFSGKMQESDFDLIYASGLYDYLPDPVARRLTEILFSKLRSQGKLLIANFLPTAENIGWMEVFMDWYLIYRDEEQMAGLASTLPESELLGSKIFVGNLGQICYNEITRQ